MKLPSKKELLGMPAVSDEDGAIIANAGRYARHAVLTAFEMIGGVERMAEWADENPGDFYTKVFAKTITKETETRQTRSIEDVIKVIEAEIVEPEADDENGQD